MAPTPNHITPARIFVTSGADTYYAIDPVHIADYLAQVRHPASFIGKANSFRVTSDGQPGVGYILLTRANLDAMDRSLSNYSITFKTVGIPLPAGEVVISNLHITNAIAVAGTISQLPGDIYLVEFKDQVDYAQLTSLNKGYNIRTPDWVSSTDFFNDSQNAGAAWTWATMLADIWTNISPIAGALTTTLVSFPTSNPDNFANFGMNAWDAALHVCHSTHNRLVCARAGTFHAISEGAADATNITYMTLARTNKILLNPSDPKSRTKTSIPEKVRVFFTKRNTAFQNSTDADVVTGTEQWRTDPTIAYTITSSAVVPALAATGTITNAIYPIYDSMVAVYNELGTLQNGAALQTQAESRATAYINSINVYENARDDLYNGAVPFEIGPNFDCIHWYDFGDGIRTQTFSSSPKKSGVIASTDCTSPVTEWPSLPDLSRWHLPSEDFIVGEVYGEAITSGSSGLVRVQFGTRTSTSVTTWADTGLPHEVRAHNILLTTYAVGDRVLCVYHRQTSRWLIVNSPGLPRLIRYSHLPAAYVESSTVKQYYPKLCEEEYVINSSGKLEVGSDRFYCANLGDLPLYEGWALVREMFNDPDYGIVYGVVEVLGRSPFNGAQYTWFAPGTAGDWTLAATDKIILRITAGSGNVLTGTSAGDTRRWVFPYGGDVMLSHPGTYEVTFGGKIRLSATDPPFDTETTSSDSGHTHTYQLRKSLTGILAVQSNFQPGVSVIGSDSYLGTKATLYMPVEIAGEAREFEKTFVFTSNPSAWHGLGYTRLSLTLACYDEVGHESSGTPKIVLDDAWMIVRPGQRDDGAQGYGDGVNQYPDGRGTTFVWYGTDDTADEPDFITKAGAAI